MPLRSVAISGIGWRIIRLYQRKELSETLMARGLKPGIYVSTDAPRALRHDPFWFKECCQSSRVLFVNHDGLTSKRLVLPPGADALYQRSFQPGRGQDSAWELEMCPRPIRAQDSLFFNAVAPFQSLSLSFFKRPRPQSYGAVAWIMLPGLADDWIQVNFGHLGLKSIRFWLHHGPSSSTRCRGGGPWITLIPAPQNSTGPSS